MAVYFHQTLMGFAIQESMYYFFNLQSSDLLGPLSTVYCHIKHINEICHTIQEFICTVSSWSTGYCDIKLIKLDETSEGKSWSVGDRFARSPSFGIGGFQGWPSSKVC